MVPSSAAGCYPAAAMTPIPLDPIMSHVVALASADIAAPGSAADFLAAYRWSRRVVLVFATGPDDPELRAQVAELTPRAPDLAERDIVVIVSADPALRRSLSVPADGFAVLLLGKDGGVKLRSAVPVAFAELAATVDAMPMRQDESRLSHAGRRTPETR